MWTKVSDPSHLKRKAKRDPRFLRLSVCTPRRLSGMSFLMITTCRHLVQVNVPWLCMYVIIWYCTITYTFLCFPITFNQQFYSSLYLECIKDIKIILVAIKDIKVQISPAFEKEGTRSILFSWRKGRNAKGGFNAVTYIQVRYRLCAYMMWYYL